LLRRAEPQDLAAVNLRLPEHQQGFQKKSATVCWKENGWQSEQKERQASTGDTIRHKMWLH
jgi:hypothetical protein